MKDAADCSYTLADLLRVMERLRDPQYGCPWDIKQDFRSIVPSTLEECYELANAIEQGDLEHLGEELGDVLFQVVFYAQLGREAGVFDFSGVVNTLVTKLIRRHPHVFASGQIEGVVENSIEADEVNLRWEQIKRDERGDKQQHGILDDVPVALPALPRAQKLQKRAAQVGLDWPAPAAVLAKLEEEVAELREAIAQGADEAIGEEMGDVLFSCVNLCRHLELDAETALRSSSNKFESRVKSMESIALAEGVHLAELDESRLDILWERAKGL